MEVVAYFQNLEGLYKGEVHKDTEVPDGIGEIQTKKGEYHGSFVNGKAEGLGRLTWANGTKVEGEWKAGESFGKRTLYFEDDRVINQTQDKKDYKGHLILDSAEHQAFYKPGPVIGTAKYSNWTDFIV